MSLWVDKYRPQQLDKMHYHVAMAARLKRLATEGDFPHLLVCGPSGAGKKTRVMAFLRELYGNGVEKLKIDQKTFTTPSGKKIEISTLSSLYHIEVNPSDVGNNDYSVIRELLKEIAETAQLDSNRQRAFKVVVITEADKLSKDAQHALRRIMEKYMANCRYILICNSTNKVISPLRSRCLSIRVAAPTIQEMQEIMQFIGRKESVSIPPELAYRVASLSGRNLRRALLMLETCRIQQLQLDPKQDIPLADWEMFLHETAIKVLEEQSPQRLYDIRTRIYELLTHCIPADLIIRGLTIELIRNLDSHLKVEIVQQAAFYEHRLICGSKPIFHIEAFLARFMSIYKRYLLESL